MAIPISLSSTLFSAKVSKLAYYTNMVNIKPDISV